MLFRSVNLSYKLLRKYYHDVKHGIMSMSESKENMYEIAKYCMNDAQKLQELIIKMSIIDNYQVTSSYSHVSLFDSYAYAVGMKVLNRVGMEACEKNILINMIPSLNMEEGKFSGAYVFPPHTGLENQRPVTGLDFASLYPSLIMTDNLSPEKIVLMREDYERYRNRYDLHEIKFMFNGRQIQA